jgi:hypothetical protein
MQLFSDDFLGKPAREIVETIKADGIFACERAVTSEAIDKILEEIGGLDFRINVNSILPAVKNNQTYFNQFLAVSRTAFDLCRDPRITSIAKEALGPTHRMVGKRIYETRHVVTRSCPFGPMAPAGTGIVASAVSSVSPVCDAGAAEAASTRHVPSVAHMASNEASSQSCWAWSVKVTSSPAPAPEETRPAILSLAENVISLPTGNSAHAAPV